MRFLEGWAAGISTSAIVVGVWLTVVNAREDSPRQLERIMQDQTVIVVGHSSGVEIFRTEALIGAGRGRRAVCFRDPERALAVSRYLLELDYSNEELFRK